MYIMPNNTRDKCFIIIFQTDNRTASYCRTIILLSFVRFNYSFTRRKQQRTKNLRKYTEMLSSYDLRV